jgi:hypothetical protein
MNPPIAWDDKNPNNHSTIRMIAIVYNISQDFSYDLMLSIVTLKVPPDHSSSTTAGPSGRAPRRADCNRAWWPCASTPPTGLANG